jgi:hypothetical protein
MTREKARSVTAPQRVVCATTKFGLSNALATSLEQQRPMSQIDGNRSSLRIGIFKGTASARNWRLGYASERRSVV